MSTHTTTLPGATVVLADAPATQTTSGDDRIVLEAVRVGLITQINAYQAQHQAAAAEDKEFWALLKQGDLIKLAAIEQRMGVPRTFVRRKR